MRMKRFAGAGSWLLIIVIRAIGSLWLLNARVVEFAEPREAHGIKILPLIVIRNF